jgi:hypothetical protein
MAKKSETQSHERLRSIVRQLQKLSDEGPYPYRPDQTARLKGIVLTQMGWRIRFDREEPENDYSGFAMVNPDDLS